MVFNWFRRQFSNSSQETDVEQEQTEQIQPEVEPSESEPTDEQSQEVAADYLDWAKAAYKNIQQRQKEQDSDVAETEVESPSEQLAQNTPQTTAELPEAETLETAIVQVAEEDSINLPEVAPVTEAAAESPAAETPETAPTQVAHEDTFPLPDSVDSPAVEQITTPPEQTLEPQASVLAEDVTPVAPLPVWAREDRQARVERLKATAIETPEAVDERGLPAASAATTLESSELVTDFPFDDGFLWSAEVLASQGRRPEDVSIEEISWLKRLRQGLEKTRRSLINQLKAIVGQGPLNQDAVTEIEALLLQADVGVEATDYIISTLQQKLREEVLPPDEAIAYLKQLLRDMLDRPLSNSGNPTFTPEKDTLNIWLMTGVNGVGKTTTIGKIAHLAQKSGYRCLIGAADTFRAAAVEQVKIWGQRSGIEVIANPAKNADPAAVVFDAIAAAQARGTELLLVDTAGRLQNKKNLMDELSKIRRIVDKKAPNAKVESLLVLDATLGQNGLRQAEVFAEAAKLSGVVLTKLDGTAKGGIALAVVQQLGLPIRFIGAGEGIEDLRPFSSYEFVEALLSG